MKNFKNSPISEINFLGRNFKIKRDDLLSSDFTGNKARKFYSLFEMDFAKYNTIVSYGGAQSNAMYSLSVFAKIKNLKFDYYVKKIPKYLQDNSSGNYAAAISYGMNLIELGHNEYSNFISSYTPKSNEFFIPQGGAFEYARRGLKILADELNEFCSNMKKPKAIISCGTGTSALFLSEYFCGEVFAIACVGDAQYLKSQFDIFLTCKKRPTIISTNKKYTFGKPHIDIYQTYMELLLLGIEFDLLYDSVAWIGVKQNIELFDEETIFIHSGGVHANITMLERYARLFMASQ